MFPSLFREKKILKMFERVVFDGSSLILIYFESASLCLQGTGGQAGNFKLRIFSLEESAQQLIRQAPRLFIFWRGAKIAPRVHTEIFQTRVRSRHLQFSRHVRRKKKEITKVSFEDRPTVRPHISHGKKRKSSFFRPVFMGISRCRSPSYITFQGRTRTGNYSRHTRISRVSTPHIASQKKA